MHRQATSGQQGARVQEVLGDHAKDGWGAHSRHPGSQALSLQTYEHNEWILHLAGKLLANDAQALSLLASSPFEGRPPPR